MKEMIVYFSRAGENYSDSGIRRLQVGNTEVAAGMLQQLTGADIFKIEMREPYSDMYGLCTQEARAHLKTGARPGIVSLPKDIDDYDIIYLGYPNYWNTMPMAMFTFLDSIDTAGKTIKPFCTHEGSGLGSSEKDLREKYPGAMIENGIALQGSKVAKAENAIRAWLA